MKPQAHKLEPRMKPWLRRIGILAFFLFWCFFLMLPTILFVGFADGQMVWGDDPQNQVRVFLMQELRKEGIGVQWSRPVTEDGACVQTTVRYFMFAGTAVDNDTCTCYTTPTTDPPPTCTLPTP
jgi:hypothetical protein